MKKKSQTKKIKRADALIQKLQKKLNTLFEKHSSHCSPIYLNTEFTDTQMDLISDSYRETMMHFQDEVREAIMSEFDSLISDISDTLVDIDNQVDWLWESLADPNH